MVARLQEPLRPLSAVASGGETARVMLAIKAAPSAGVADGGGGGGGGWAGCPVLVLDELDTGVGGRLGQRVGALMERMCRGPGAPCGQLLCVSHLPQVAAHAGRHLVVAKGADAAGRTTTKVRPLRERAARVEELAAMLGLSEPAGGGAGDTELAAALLEAAQGARAAGGKEPLQVPTLSMEES